MDDITFIIPTIGRTTLQNSIQSIINQTHTNWKIIIVFDGVDPTIQKNNNKIFIIKSDKKGKDINSAGNVRNFGMELVDTKWIAFLDDDDVISNNYVETFNNEINSYPNVDVIIFRMLGENDNVLPPLNTDNFYINKVGISFAMKTEIYKSGYKFIPSNVEDFNYLDLIRQNNYNIMISPYVKYFVNYIQRDHTPEHQQRDYMLEYQQRDYMLKYQQRDYMLEYQQMNSNNDLITKNINKYVNNTVVGNRVFINVEIMLIQPRGLHV